MTIEQHRNSQKTNINNQIYENAINESDKNFGRNHFTDGFTGRVSLHGPGGVPVKQHLGKHVDGRRVPWLATQTVRLSKVRGKGRDTFLNQNGPPTPTLSHTTFHTARHMVSGKPHGLYHQPYPIPQTKNGHFQFKAPHTAPETSHCPYGCPCGITAQEGLIKMTITPSSELEIR